MKAAQSSKLKAQRKKLKILIFALLLSAFIFQLSAYCAEDDISTAEKLFLEGRYERAIEETDRIIDARCRRRDEVYYLKGLSELKAKRFKDARESFEYILSRYQRSARTFEAHLGIADSYFLEGNIGQALKLYNDILNKFPDDRNVALARQRIENCSRRPDFKPPEIPRGESGQFISVQVGCFKNKKNAERLTQKLSRAGYDSYIETPTGAGERLYRVKVGRLKSDGEARGLAARLNGDGYKTKICNDAVSE